MNIYSSPEIMRQKFSFSKDFSFEFDLVVKDWEQFKKTEKVWARDPTLWTGSNESKWMDWLTIIQQKLKEVSRLQLIAEEIKNESFQDVLLIGMGGASICAELFSKTFNEAELFPKLQILDSTDPGQIKSKADSIAIEKTLFIISSKSGSTLETDTLRQYFFSHAKNTLSDNAGAHFMAITDPGSQLDWIAKRDNYRQIFYGIPGIGGRYSALSEFGLVPAAVIGVDVQQLLKRSEEMHQACLANVPAIRNPGVLLGLILGFSGRNGQNKVTFVSSPGISYLGSWLEQLLAESTGKNGRGLIPIIDEFIGSPENYGADRIFVYLRLSSSENKKRDLSVKKLEQAGFPVVTINLDDCYELGQEIFRWEIATVVASSVLEVNPFDQPDVDVSKVKTRTLTQAYEKKGRFQIDRPIVRETNFSVFANKETLNLLDDNETEITAESLLRAHLDLLSAGDYWALLGYLEMKESYHKKLQSIRETVQKAKRVATCLNYGPRFLHSTGQIHKGGPNAGVFLQITCEDSFELFIPGKPYTFGIIKEAQALGDFQALIDYGRRILRVHLSLDIERGLTKLDEIIQNAVK